MDARRLGVRAFVVVCALGALLAFASAPALAAKVFVPLGAFGHMGSGEGEFNEPAGIAVNDSTDALAEPAAGDVYVADARNHRIQRFSSEGVYISQFDGEDTPSKELGEIKVLAVDNSENPLDPSAGDVYVATGEGIEQFTATGVYTGKTIPVPKAVGLTVDRSGNLWVYEQIEEDEGKVTRNIVEFTDTGSFVKSFDAENTPYGTPHGIAVDSADNVYVETTGHAVLKFDGATGTRLAEFASKGEVTALAVDPSTNDLAVDERGVRIAVYGAFGEPYSTPIETFPLGENAGPVSEGLAIGSLGALYVVQREAAKIERFSDTVPYPRTGKASAAIETSVTLHGALNPNEETVSGCEFEYGVEESYGQTVPCAQTPAQIGTGTTPVPVSAEVTGLQPLTSYHFRLVSSGVHGTAPGSDETFFTVAHAHVEGESVSNVLSSSATVGAQVNAGGLPTSYRVEYGTSEQYGSSTPESSVGAPDSSVSVLAQLSGLQPGTLYHARLVATNALGSTPGSDVSFLTTSSSVASTTLPDDRAYELVSSPTSNADVYPPVGEVEANVPNQTFNLVRAAAGGNGVVYQADPGNAAEGGAGTTAALSGNAYIATRTSSGWTQTDLQFDSGLAYEWFSNELTVGVLQPRLESGSLELSRLPASEPSQPANCTATPLFSYTSATGSYSSLVGSTPTSAPMRCSGEYGGANEGTTTVAPYSHILSQSPFALTPEASESTVEGLFNLYDSVGGRLYLVSVLPDGQPAVDARFAGDEPVDKEDDAAHEDGQFTGGSINGAPADISADGSRVFWGTFEPVEDEEVSPLALYMRENDTQPQSPVLDGKCTVAGDACTVQIDAKQPGAEGESGGGLFRAASDDGSKVFFTDERRLTVDSTAAPGEPDLYEYEVGDEAGAPGTLTDLTVDTHGGEHADVLGLMGISADGSYVYFGADGVLSSEKNVEGNEPVAGQPNLYMIHDGVTTLIATADPDDEEYLGANSNSHEIGDLKLNLALHTSEVTPSGQNVVFRSRTQLTHYENDGLAEVFVYDAETAHISCVSCAPTGVAPDSGVAPFSDGAMLTLSHDSDFALRWISEDGARVFFVTAQPLVRQDVNGLLDVYEWERPVSGSESDNSCTVASPSFSQVNGGCVYLLSGGTSTDYSYFLDASANGNDVFIRSRAHLTSQSVNENMALYDARVGGGFTETRLACTGTGCQGVPPTGPIFATPSSATFNGVGNFPAPIVSVTKVSKKAAKCSKGKKVVHGKCVKRKTNAKKTGHKRSKKRGKR